ncbi:MAG: pirin family protein [Epsilonproteobacteria bacterium]|nr:pirin family protein [Campylobacterota bacterium]
MLQKINTKNLFLADYGWLQSKFHFSFAEYKDIKNIKFGALRVLNDDIIQPHQGFGMHPHHNMEIITYIIEGELTHQDSMGNKETLQAGEVQYMSAGTGVMHSEINESDKLVRLLQIWILPPQERLKPRYGSHRYLPHESHNKLLHIVSSQKGNAAVKIYQDSNIFVGKLNQNRDLKLEIKPERQLYFVQIEGTSQIRDIVLNSADALKIIDESQLELKTLSDSHFLFIDLKKE